jgi:multiple sugar transport system permease protein
MNQKAKDQTLAWALMTPSLLVLSTFGLFPIAYAVYVSVHKWRIKKGDFVGLDHYARALGDLDDVGLFLAGAAMVAVAFWLFGRCRRLTGSRAPAALGSGAVLCLGLWLGGSGLESMLETGDTRLYNGFKVTFFYALGTIPVQLSVAMVLANLLFHSWRAQGPFRVAFFLPYVTPVIASAVVFRAIFSPHPSSLANRFWAVFGMENQRWLYESKSVVFLALTGAGVDCPGWVNDCFPSLALVSIILYNVWVYIGYDTVILLAGLSAIPSHYYEAAQMDGASSWQSFRNITLPLVSPTLFFLTVVAVIGTFKAFNHIYIMRTPGARDSVDVVSVAIFDLIFEQHNAGYASAMSFILFIAILALTLVQKRVIEKRVFYGG